MTDTYTVYELVEAAGVKNADELCDYIFSSMGKPGKYQPSGRDDEFVFKFVSIDEINDLVNIQWKVVTGERDETYQSDIPITEDIIYCVKGSDKY